MKYNKKYDKYSKKKLIKYDKNNDGLISLEEYLANEISLGDKAKKGEIEYHYQDYENIYNYFFIIFLKIKKYKIMCMNSFVLEYDNYKNRTAIAYDIKNNKLYIHKNMEKSLKACKKNVRFIYFTFINIPSKEVEITHANIVIIDLFKKTIERFEPYGHDGFNKTVTKKIDNLFEKKIKKKLGLEKYKYISPTQISPKLGIQSKVDAYCGMCITISMMYLHLRILNPDIDQNKLVKFILNRPKKKLKEMILKYAKFVEDTLKKNTNIVLKLTDEVYNNF